MSDIQDAIIAATAKAAIALADAAVTREKCKHHLMKHRECGNTCTREFEDLKSTYKAAKRRYRSCLEFYIKEAQLLATKEGMKDE